jgi:proteasome assembly chaperone (PAC2) family protein
MNPRSRLADMDGSALTGMNGPIVRLVKFKGMSGTCLSDETTGYIVDVKLSRSLLEVLTRKLGIVISMEALNAKAKDTVMLIKNN